MKFARFAVSLLVLGVLACDPLAGVPVSLPTNPGVKQLHSLVANYGRDVVGDQPTGFWRFQETNSSAGAEDQGSSGSTGSYGSGVTLEVPGPLLIESGDSDVSRAAGMLGANSLVVFNGIPSPASSSSWAIEFWINLASGAVAGQVNLVQWNSVGGASPSVPATVYFDAPTQTIHAVMQDASGGISEISLDASTSLDQWNHVAWVVDGSVGGTQALYWNDQPLLQSALPVGGLPDLGTLQVGGSSANDTWFAIGELALFSGNVPPPITWPDRFHVAGY